MLEALVIRKYKTKPLECWSKAKEIRMAHYQDVGTARDKGKLIVTGGTDGFIALPSGLGDYVFLGGEPYGAAVGNDPSFSIECHNAVEARGFARDLCAYLRSYWGSMFLDKYYFGGRFPRPDFCLQMHVCDSQAKWYQQVSEFFGVPYFGIEMPVVFQNRGLDDGVEYLAAQLHEAIEWMCKITGRSYDDEKLIEAVRNECLTQSLWGEIALLNQNIPAPLDQKSLFSLYVIGILIRHKKESVDFYKQLKDEVKERAANEIAALATERCRILDDCMPPWSFLEIYRYLEKFGAVTVGSLYTFSLLGAFEEAKDLTWSRKKMPEEEGKSLKNRDDALRVLARWYLERPINGNLTLAGDKNPYLLKAVKDWHCNGAMIHLNRGCKLFATGLMENRIALEEAGVPVMTYEGNMGDEREVDKTKIYNNIDTFMDRMGMNKLLEDKAS